MPCGQKETEDVQNGLNATCQARSKGGAAAGEGKGALTRDPRDQDTIQARDLNAKELWKQEGLKM